MTDQERNLTAAMNAHRFSEEVARQKVQRKIVREFEFVGPTPLDGIEFVAVTIESCDEAAELQRQAQQRKTFGGE